MVGFHSRITKRVGSPPLSEVLIIRSQVKNVLFCFQPKTEDGIPEQLVEEIAVCLNFQVVKSSIFCIQDALVADIKEAILHFNHLDAALTGIEHFFYCQVGRTAWCFVKRFSPDGVCSMKRRV